MPGSNLAIVVPAYKTEFFGRTMESLAAQTRKDFTVYIGADGGSGDFTPFVKQYGSELNIVFRQFEDNLGGQDLVAQWTRCIGMTSGEKWIWLFSDDDVMDSICVESFYKAVSANPDADLFHFDVEVIDSVGRAVEDHRYVKEAFPANMSSLEFARKRLSFMINSFVVEYVFRKEAFDRIGGFVRMDMAWGSDDATWIRLASEFGIVTVPGAMVHWRKSESNITPGHSRESQTRKMSSVVAYLCFLDDTFADGSMHPLFWNYFLRCNRYSIGIVSLSSMAENAITLWRHLHRKK